jgi:hypothetical protein
MLCFKIDMQLILTNLAVMICINFIKMFRNLLRLTPTHRSIVVSIQCLETSCITTVFKTMAIMSPRNKKSAFIAGVNERLPTSEHMPKTEC